MAFAVQAVWTAKPGEEGRIADVIRTMTPLSLAEPGCLYYRGQVSTDAPNVFLLYEQYVDAAAYEAHKASEHFGVHVKEYALDYLERREVKTFVTLD